MASFRRVPLAAALALAVAGAPPASAQMFWKSPDFSGTPVTGAEPDVVVPLPGATEAENSANLAWAMRAGLNVAALQCQFSPALRTVDQYNDLLAHHAKELTGAYTTLAAYFKRVDPKTAQVALDQYTTRTYNSFSTLHAQFGFCQVSSQIGYEALTLPKGQFASLAARRMREYRNSLRPMGDLIFTPVTASIPYGIAPAVARFTPDCYDKKGRPKRKCIKARERGEG